MIIDGIEITLLPGHQYSAKTTSKILGKSIGTLSNWRSRGVYLRFIKRDNGGISYDGGDIADHLKGINVRSTSEYRVKKSMTIQNNAKTSQTGRRNSKK